MKMHLWKIITIAFFCSPLAQAALNVDIASESALLINRSTRKVLFAKNASQPMYPASCTKIAFALYAIKFHPELFDKKIICSQNALKTLSTAEKSKNNFAKYPSYILETDASHMGLKVGEEMTFYELLEGTMVVSADDASNMIAEIMGEGSIEKCVQDVNAYLASIGCKNTHFTNPHGLHHPDHVTTAEDLALLAQEAMKEPLFVKMAKMTCFQRPQTNKQDAVTLRQTNRLLTKSSSFYYPEATGLKTGHHSRAGYCLTASAQKEGRELISVVLHASTSDERFQDTRKLFDAAFQEPLKKRTVFSKGKQTFEKRVEGGKTSLKTEISQTIGYQFYPSEEPVASYRLAWKDLNLPIKKGCVVGEIDLLLDGQVHKTIPLLAANDVELTFFASIKKHFLWIVLGGGLLLIWIIPYTQTT